MRTRFRTGTHSLLRKESFGGTLFSVATGKRAYISNKEYEVVRMQKKLSFDMANLVGATSHEVMMVEPNFLPDDTFSAPDTVFLEITRACNLRCTHCFNDSGKILSSQLDSEQFMAVIRDLAKAGVQEIRFTGGEPLVFPKIIQLIAHASDLGLRVSVGTNAVLIDETKARELLWAGLHAAVVSLDGLQDVHDVIRGQGSFQSTLVGVNALRSVGIPIRINTVVMKSTLKDLPLFLKIFVEMGVSVFLRRYIFSGRANDLKGEMLSSEEYERLKDVLKPFLCDPRGLVDGHYLSERTVQTRISLPFTRHDCSAGQRGLVILPDGRIQTCGFLGPLGEKSVGRVPETSIEQIWKNLRNSQHIPLLRSHVDGYNARTKGPQTNCLAIVMANQEPRKRLRIEQKGNEVLQ